MLVAVVSLLLLNGIWNILVWPTFLRRVARDPRARDSAGRPTRFLVVHAVLVGFSLLLGVASIITAIVVLA
ncbi:MAG TPA: hypothetical protein VIL55_04935 [Naasia sp.]